MAPIRGPAWALCTLSSALLILTGCDKLTHGETDWARSALERNPDLTIVASDAEAKTFTVQVKGSSELRVVRLDQIIGDVPSDGVAPKVNQPGQPERASASTQTPEANDPSNATASADERASPPEETSARTPSSSVNPGAASGTGVVKDAAGNVLASVGPGTEATTPTATGSNKVLASGPGYTVSAGTQRASRPIRLAEATPAPKSPANTARERRYEPMICQGNRLLHLDNRNLEFEGDALSVLDGCEIHITNSHIIARGVGVFARGANVYIKNSIIEGESGSVSASGGAKIYTQQSTFKGLSRRLDTATFTDLGGTVWN
jgi:hypothetical protein